MKFFKRSSVTRAPSSNSANRTGETTVLKNGRLTLGVIASVLLMILLGAINIYLIRDSSIAGKAFGPILEQPDTCVAKTKPSQAAANSAVCQEPLKKRTEITFYRNLQEDGFQDPTHAALSRAAESGATISEANLNDKNGPKDILETSSEKKQSPRTQEKPKTFSVQVGSFSNPAIAQEWARKWKAKGYEVILRPTARPETGVIYRLMLGAFPTEQSADEFSKQLKSKEGISGISLAVRN